MPGSNISVGDDRRGTPTQWSSRTIFPLTSVILLALAAVLWATALSLSVDVATENPTWIVITGLVIALAIGETFPLKFEIRRETLMVSLSEMPLVLGLLLFDPAMVGGAYIGAGILAFALRRDTWRSNLLNLSLITAESGLAVLIVSYWHAPVGQGDLLDQVADNYLPVAVGVLAGALLSGAVVSITYRLTGVTEPMSRMMLRSMTTAGMIVAISLTGFTVWNALPGGPLLTGVLILVLILVYRYYALFLRQHTALAQMYVFGDSVAQAGGSVPAWRDLLGQVAELLDARAVTMYLMDHGNGPAVVAVGDADNASGLHAEDSDPIFEQARSTSGCIVSVDQARYPAVVEALEKRDAWQAMSVELRSGDRSRGYVEVYDRRSRWRRYSDDDLQLLRVLCGHLATALDNHRLLQSLRQAAYRDPVTGLYSRQGLQAEMRGEGDFDGGENFRFNAIVLIELGVISQVSSALGHERGEQLLAILADNLLAGASADQLIGRVDGDRFAILLSVPDEHAATEIAYRVIEVGNALVSVGGMDIEPQSIAGLAISDPDKAPNPEDPANEVLLQHAQLALESARTKNSRLEVYRSNTGEKYQRRFQLISQFRHAVSSGRVTLHYQPKLLLAERELLGVEALVRWLHPEYGYVSPAELIEAIEPTKSIDILFKHVLDLALAQLADWHQRHMRMTMAVNVSVRNLLADDFLDTVTSTLSRYDVPAELLTLELTESSVMENPDITLPILRELNSIGVELSVDDFGTGYSSLAYLRRLPIHEIKIDRSFVQGMVTDLGDLAIVRAIIELGHSLGLRVVAEGVEEEAGRDALRSMRCDAMQGFLLARPLAIDRFESWLSSRVLPHEGQAVDPHSFMRIRV